MAKTKLTTKPVAMAWPMAKPKPVVKAEAPWSGRSRPWRGQKPVVEPKAYVLWGKAAALANTYNINMVTFNRGARPGHRSPEVLQAR